MTSFVLVIAVTAFLAGAATAVFVMLVIGIRKADRPRARPPARGTPLDAVTRSTLAARHLAQRSRPRRPPRQLTAAAAKARYFCQGRLGLAPRCPGQRPRKQRRCISSGFR